MRSLLAKAHSGALAKVRERLKALPAGVQPPAEQAMADCQACVLQLFEGLLSPEEAEARMVSMLHGHTDPRVVNPLQDYADTLRLLLTEARRELISPDRSKEN